MLFPIATIAATLFYLDRMIAPGEFAPYAPPEDGQPQSALGSAGD
jgi:hypothetical protein